MQQTSYYPFGMTLQQQNFGGIYNRPNNFLYNGKELQDDELAGSGLDWYDYGARFYDAQLGRWHVVDPLAEKYFPISSYAYVANNPIIFIDPDGREIKVYREQGQSGTNPTVVIQVTGKLVNNSSTSYSQEQLQGYADRLASSISSSFSGTGEGINFRADVNITVATETNGVAATDHQFIIHDQGSIPGAKGNNDVLGSAKLGGKEINISQHILGRTVATSGANAGTGKTDSGHGTLERTGAHELGHSATLEHPTPGTLDNNLMHQTRQPNAGMVVTESQILQIEQAFKDDKLNK